MKRMLAGIALALAVSTASRGEFFADAAQRLKDGAPSRAAFAEAAQRIAGESDRSPERWLNLGNALFLAGQRPEAIAAYRSGLRVDPSHSILGRHLDLVRGRGDWPEGTRLAPPRASWPRWLRVPPVAAFLAFAIACLFTPAGLIGRRRAFVAIGLVAAVVGMSALGIEWLARQSLADDANRPTVVVRVETPFRIGNGDSYPTHPDAASLPLGYEVVEISRRGDWVHVECPGGQVGWIQRSATLTVGD